MFKCFVCNCNFQVTTEYLSHVKNAHGHVHKFQFSCGFNECPIQSKNFHAFKKHLFKHEELCPKPIKFTCGCCGFHTFHKRKLICHYKSHSIIECPVNNCNRSYTNFSSFTSHLSRNHPTFLVDSNPSNGPQTESNERVSEISVGSNTGETSNTHLSDLQMKVSTFILKLQEQFLLPQSTITEIVLGIKEIQECQLDLIKRDLSLELSKNNIDESVLKTNFYTTEIDVALDSMKSSHLRKNFMNYGNIFPVEYKLNNDKSFQYVPLINNLKEFCKNKDILKYIIMPSPTQNDLLCDVQDGSMFKHNNLFKQYPNIQIILYLDDFLVTNPLRGNQARHKLTGFYYTIANLPYIYRSTVDDMQLAIICHTSDIKEFGFRSILAPFLKDLKLLEDIGINIEGITEKVKGSLVAVVGDNLALHQIGGYTTNFSSSTGHICRFCMATYEDMINFKEKNFTRRTKQNHENQIELINIDNSNINLFGLKFNSPLNDLKFFHTSIMLPPDAMHDLLEGIVPLELSLIITSLIKSKFISLSLLNRRIQSVKFGFNDKPNEPYVLNGNFSKGIKMTASRIWSLLRFLPLMIGVFVPENDIVWNFLLILKDIVDIILSPVINTDYISLLSGLIYEHHNLFKRLFKETKLKPKHHFLVHYPQLILEFGPLVHLWSMRFEAKHLYFKRVAQASKNTKNLPLTLAQRHQQLQCLYNSQGRNLLKNIVVTSAKPIEKNIYSAEIDSILEGYEQFFQTSKVIISGIAYKPGMCVVVSFENDEPLFGKITIILCKRSKVLFVCKIYNSCYIFHIRGYQLITCDILKVIEPEKLLHYYPLSIYKYGNNSVVIPKHLLFDH